MILLLIPHVFWETLYILSSNVILILGNFVEIKRLPYFTPSNQFDISTKHSLQKDSRYREA